MLIAVMKLFSWASAVIYSALRTGTNIDPQSPAHSAQVFADHYGQKPNTYSSTGICSSVVHTLYQCSQQNHIASTQPLTKFTESNSHMLGCIAVNMLYFLLCCSSLPPYL